MASNVINSAFDTINSYDLFTQKPGESAQLGSGHVCLKRTIMAVNAFFLLLGIILTSVGSAGASNAIAQFAGNSLPVGVLVIGVFIMLISLLGCCGARRESRFILGVYSVLLVIMILCQISVGIAVYVKKDQAPELLTVAWDATNNWQKVTLIQNPLQCCGLLIYNRTAPAGVDAIRVSGLAGQPCPDINLFPNSYQMPCMQPMLNQIQSSFVTVGIVAISFAFLQIIGFCFTLCLIRGIKLARDQDQMVDQTVDAAELEAANPAAAR